MQNLSIKDVNFLLECIKAKEDEFSHKKMQSLFMGMLSDKSAEEKAENISKKMESISKEQTDQEENITIIKAKLYTLRDELNQQSIINQASEKLDKPYPKMI